MRKMISVLSVVIITIGAVDAQTIEREVFASAGDHFTNSDFSISWTLGETMIETYENQNMLLTQGFHQPTKLELTAIKENLVEDYQISVYPNPAVDQVNIKFQDSKEDIINVQVYDMKGKKVMFERHQQPDHIELDFTELAEANYLLSLRKHNGELITTYLINKTR